MLLFITKCLRYESAYVWCQSFFLFQSCNQTYAPPFRVPLGTVIGGIFVCVCSSVHPGSGTVIGGMFVILDGHHQTHTDLCMRVSMQSYSELC